jgi:hypothetical protein
MTLREKFEQWFINDEDEHYEGMVEAVSIEHEKIADEFAIEFSEWAIVNMIEYAATRVCSGKRLYYLKPNSCTMEELLEIYKKERGL